MTVTVFFLFFYTRSARPVATVREPIRDVSIKLNLRFENSVLRLRLLLPSYVGASVADSSAESTCAPRGSITR